MEPEPPPAPEQDPDDDERAFIASHMQKQRQEEDFWKHASLAELTARMDAVQEQSRQRAAEAAWREEQRKRQEAQTAGTGRTSPVAPIESYRTTVDDLKDMLGRDSYPTWFQAAYADLAGRMIRIEAQLDDQATTLSLLHGKVEDILGYLIGRDGGDEPTQES